MPAEIVRSKSNTRSAGAVLFLHGGAFMIGSPVSHRVAISPWADLTLTRLAPVADDALLRAAWLKQGAAAYLQSHSARDPLVSPLLADLTGLPPTLIQAASEEILRDDSRRLTEALSADGVSVTHRGNKRNFLKLLLRFVRSNVRGHIESRPASKATVMRSILLLLSPLPHASD
jgi:acetyl esterase/lipase